MNLLLKDGRMLVPYTGERGGVCFDDIAYMTPDYPMYESELRFAVPIEDVPERELPAWRRQRILEQLDSIPPLPLAQD